MTEYAKHHGAHEKTPIEQVPQFRSYLKRTGKTLQQWQDEQPKPDPDSEALSLARRKLSLNTKGKK